ncbi:hypothetical protein MGA3_06940 [Bacillus methanolicus MGA3]|nr:hypothetical protein MGA3_06940 [Bacillus methanolicus MGA3]
MSGAKLKKLQSQNMYLAKDKLEFLFLIAQLRPFSTEKETGS